MRYPALIMGILMFIIFLNQESTKKWWNEISRRRIPSTCDVLVGRVKEKAPSNWKMECPTTQLLVLTVDFEHSAKGHQEQRVLMYKEVVNILTKLAFYSNIETLEYLQKVRIILKHQSLIITSQTDGQATAKFKTLKDKEEILQHLKLTVKVSEKTP